MLGVHDTNPAYGLPKSHICPLCSSAGCIRYTNCREIHKFQRKGEIQDARARALSLSHTKTHARARARSLSLSLSSPFFFFSLSLAPPPPPRLHCSPPLLPSFPPSLFLYMTGDAKVTKLDWSADNALRFQEQRTAPIDLILASEVAYCEVR